MGVSEFQVGMSSILQKLFELPFVSSFTSFSCLHSCFFGTAPSVSCFLERLFFSSSSNLSMFSKAWY